MKTTFLTLTLIPAALAAELIKMWKTSPGDWLPTMGTRCYATVANSDGCQNACALNARHVFFDKSNWWEHAQFGRFTDPRAGTDKWLNIWPDGDQNWGVFIEDGDGKRIGNCKIANDGNCKCANEAQAMAFAICEMDE